MEKPAISYIEGFAGDGLDRSRARTWESAISRTWM